jgi:multicomponent Na+:H+ antiporter subunit B
MKISNILITISRLLYPFILLFAFYIIINGDISPGGGFQGGAILATGLLLGYFIDVGKVINVSTMLRIEKSVYILLVLVCGISFITTGEFFTNFLKNHSYIPMRRLFLVLLNILIGIKVSLGLISIVSIFVEEGRA